MSEVQTKKGARRFKWLWWVLIIIAIIVILWLLLRGRTSYTTTGDRRTKVTFLSCESSSVEDPFFVSPYAKTFTHEVKATFSSDDLADITYAYDATYESTAIAETANSRMHGDYNIYMGEHDLPQESLIPNFATGSSTVHISLFAEKSQLNGVTDVLFFLATDDFRADPDYSLSGIRQTLEDQKFTCTYYE